MVELKISKEKYAEIEEIGDQQDDKNSWSYYSNQLKAIAGLQKKANCIIPGQTLQWLSAQI